MSVQAIIKLYPWSFSFTTLLVLTEAGLTLLFPLFIGMAIEGALAGATLEVWYLGGLGILTLFVGAGRRFFDSRFYAKVYQVYSMKLLNKLNDQEDSVKIARLGMLQEVVEFLENTLPELVNQLLGLIGVVVIIGLLDAGVFAVGAVAILIVSGIYGWSSKRTLRFNSAFNNELEQQAKVLNQPVQLRRHLKGLMHWNIKLSDLETMNFSLSWVVLMGFLVFSILLAIQGGITSYGLLFSLIMYVFQCIESIVSLPFIYQEWLRLTEIKQRLELS